MEHLEVPTARLRMMQGRPQAPGDPRLVPQSRITLP